MYLRPTYNGAFNMDHEIKPKSESYFNLINDKENLNRINKIANEGVNHIVAAFYIKSVQQIAAAKNIDNVNNIIQRRSSNSIPINSVNLDEDTNNTHNNEIINNNFFPSTSNLENNQIEKNAFQLKMNIFNDKFTTDVNEITANQLNTVNDVMKRLKEKKMNEFNDKEYLNIKK